MKVGDPIFGNEAADLLVAGGELTRDFGNSLSGPHYRYSQAEQRVQVKNTQDNSWCTSAVQLNDVPGRRWTITKLPA